MPTNPKPKTTQEMVEYLATKSQFDILAPDERWTPDLANARSELFETGDERTDQPPLVKKLREKVYIWRQNDYAGVSATTRSLLTHWFSCEHIRYKPNGDTYSFQWYFGQREAVETAIYILEVAGIREATDLKSFRIQNCEIANYLINGSD